jgi:serine/threonine kinase 32
MKAVANIVQERRLLEEVSGLYGPSSRSTAQRLIFQIDHPFVVNMRYAFQDDENCFFVLDLMLGGDLRCELAYGYDSTPWLTRAVHLDRAGAMTEETVRFYIAEIAMAVDYLHSKRIVHR